MPAPISDERILENGKKRQIHSGKRSNGYIVTSSSMRTAIGLPSFIAGLNFQFLTTLTWSRVSPNLYTVNGFSSSATAIAD
jgi:hypothetical protein